MIEEILKMMLNDNVWDFVHEEYDIVDDSAIYLFDDVSVPVKDFKLTISKKMILGGCKKTYDEYIHEKLEEYLNKQYPSSSTHIIYDTCNPPFECVSLKENKKGGVLLTFRPKIQFGRYVEI